VSARLSLRGKVLGGAVLVAALLTGACGGPSPDPEPTSISGLYGTIHVYPGGQLWVIDALVVVRHCGNPSWVTSFKIEHSDHYRVALPPGHWCLETYSPDGAQHPLLKRTEVDVRPHEFSEATLFFDSGIR
jgi:hypothetical protein